MGAEPATVEAYVASFPTDVQPVLQGVLDAVRAAVPGAEESISYGMPRFSGPGLPLVYVGGWKRHVGIYPVPELGGGLEPEVAPYRSSKATVRFPLSRPVPFELVTRIVARLPLP